MPESRACPAGRSTAERGEQRVGEQQQQGDGDADHRHGVEQAGDDEHLGLQHRGQLRLAGRAFDELAAEDGEADRGAEGAEADQEAGRDDGELDRKSTRLNSSHVKISYAVFCLKKKKKRNKTKSVE